MNRKKADITDPHGQYKHTAASGDNSNSCREGLERFHMLVAK